MPNIEILRQIASLNQSAKQIINRNPQEALALANEALILALDVQDPTSICSSHYFVGIGKWRLGQLNDAITSLQEADIINKYLEQPIHEVEILKKVYLAIIAGGEKVGFDLSPERSWLNRLLASKFRASA